MKLHLFGLACLLALPALGLSVAHAADLSAQDKMFISKAAQGGMLEVEAGKVAQDQAAAQDVKDFGARMVTDHGKANDELNSIAMSKGINPPPGLDAKHQKMLDDLKAKSGAAFDKAYLHMMWKAHQADDKLFTTEASSGTDEDVKNFAAKTDQIVKMHIQMLRDIHDKMK